MKYSATFTERAQSGHPAALSEFKVTRDILQTDAHDSETLRISLPFFFTIFSTLFHHLVTLARLREISLSHGL